MYAISAAGNDELNLFLLQLSAVVKSLFDLDMPKSEGFSVSPIVTKMLYFVDLQSGLSKTCPHAVVNIQTKQISHKNRFENNNNWLQFIVKRIKYFRQFLGRFPSAA